MIIDTLEFAHPTLKPDFEKHGSMRSHTEIVRFDMLMTDDAVRQSQNLYNKYYMQSYIFSTNKTCNLDKFGTVQATMNDSSTVLISIKEEVKT